MNEFMNYLDNNNNNEKNKNNNKNIYDNKEITKINNENYNKSI